MLSYLSWMPNFLKYHTRTVKHHSTCYYQMLCKVSRWYLPPAYEIRREGNVLTRVCLSACLSVHSGEVSTLDVGYLPWMGGRSTYLGWYHNLDGEGGIYLWRGRHTYLGRGGVPTLDRERGTCLGWGEVPTLDGKEGYLPCMGEGVPTLDRGRGTYLGLGYLPWTGYAVGGIPLAGGSGNKLFLFLLQTVSRKYYDLEWSRHEPKKCLEWSRHKAEKCPEWSRYNFNSFNYLEWCGHKAKKCLEWSRHEAKKYLEWSRYNCISLEWSTYIWYLDHSRYNLFCT